MNMMQSVSQPSDLSPLDMQRYFSWPPSSRLPRLSRARKKWPLRLFIWLIVIYFFLFIPLSFMASFDASEGLGVVTLVFLVIEFALLIYMLCPVIYWTY